MSDLFRQLRAAEYCYRTLSPIKWHPASIQKDADAMWSYEFYQKSTNQEDMAYWLWDSGENNGSMDPFVFPGDFQYLTYEHVAEFFGTMHSTSGNQFWSDRENQFWSEEDKEFVTGIRQRMYDCTGAKIAWDINYSEFNQLNLLVKKWSEGNSAIGNFDFSLLYSDEEVQAHIKDQSEEV